MSYPLPVWGIEDTISFGPECSANMNGTPAMVIDAQQNLYFAAMARGTNPVASKTIPSTIYNKAYNLVIGSVDNQGNLLWYTYFPELVATSNQRDVSLAIGNNNDLYVAFATPTAVQGCVNMSNIPIFCPCANPGPYDIVLARINYSSTSQKVAWYIQNAELNSCSNENIPQLAVDPTTGVLYVAYQTSGNVLCFNPVGAPNVVLSCFNLNGQFLWAEERNNINGAGVNGNPSVTADLSGNVYLAYETSSTVQGGATIIQTQVEVVKFHTVLTPSKTLASYNRVWVLSQYSNIFAPNGTCYSPSITCYGSSLYLAFLTSGSVNGKPHTYSVSDLVVCKINVNGTLIWVNQGSQFNRAPYTYIEAGSPFIKTDGLPNNESQSVNVYVSLQTYSKDPTPGGNQNTLVFSMTGFDGTNNFSNVQGFNALPYAYSGAQCAVLPTASAPAYSQLVLCPAPGFIYMSLISQVPLNNQKLMAEQFDIIMTKYILYTYYPNISPFQFMSGVKSICNCGAKCSCTAPATIVPDTPTNLVATAGNQSASIWFTPGADGSSLITNYLYSIDNGITFTLFLPAQAFPSVNITGLTNNVTYRIQLKAVSQVGMSPPSPTVTVTPHV